MTTLESALVDALQDALNDLQDWADDHAEPGAPFVETERVLAKGREALVLAGVL